MDRKPRVAGQFYPASKSELEKELKKLMPRMEAKTAKAVIAPHAGYVYSGAVAGKVFSSVDIPDQCVVISPNHTGMGARAAVWAKGKWLIPTGEVQVDDTLTAYLISTCDVLTEDYAAHISEHSLEVMLPFMFARNPNVKIVPITVSRLNIEAITHIGQAIASLIKRQKNEILIVVSTDMNHYEDQARTLEKDRLAIECVTKMSAEGLLSTCGRHGITMCGVIPTAIAIVACGELGATSAKLIEHKTSGDTSGDYDAVVGYAGFVIE